MFALFLISSLPLSQIGRYPLIMIPMDARITENIIMQVIDWRKTSRASLFFFAPIRCATCTLKPDVAALHIPLNSQVEAATSPIDAESFAPNCPTIDASIYCIMIDDSCTIIAGILNRAARCNCWERVMVAPFLISDSNMSFLDSFISIQSSAKKSILPKLYL